MASTFDDFTPHLLAAADALPTIQQEVGDSWIFGPASDPVRLARVRLFQRQRSACIAAGSCGVSEAELRNFSRFLMKDAEHTFGASTWHYNDDKHPGDLPISSGYDNDVFWAARTRAYSGHDNDSAVRVMEHSWREQRAWGLDYALAALPPESPLARGIAAEIEATTPAAPAPDPGSLGFVRVEQPTRPLRMLGGWLDIDLDLGGAITRFEDRLSGRGWAGVGRPLAQMRYHTELDCHGYEHHEPDCELSAMRKEYRERTLRAAFLDRSVVDLARRRCLMQIVVVAGDSARREWSRVRQAWRQLLRHVRPHGRSGTPRALAQERHQG